MSDLFELNERYGEMLDQGIGLSGEDQHFFIAGRVRHLVKRLGTEFRPRRILDYGCHNGHTAPYLEQAFPGAEVVGVDTAGSAVAWARSRYGSERIRFHALHEMPALGPFDLCYTNGVFHHIPPAARPEALRGIYDALAPAGVLALFENNPWNPGTRLVMSRIPFDRDAVTLAPPEARRLAREAGFDLRGPTRSLFYFPRVLGFLRFTEGWLEGAPLGAQYCVLAARGADR